MKRKRKEKKVKLKRSKEEKQYYLLQKSLATQKGGNG